MRDKSKPPSTRSAGTRDEGTTRNEAGRVTHDDRGNAIWEWAISTGAFGVKESVPKPAKLDNPTLALIDEEAPPRIVTTLAKENPQGTVKGYSPYDSGVLGGTKEPPRKKDLRKLSEWLQLKKQAEIKKTGHR